MISKVISAIEKYNMIKAGDRIVIGVSGGADSVALLNALVSLRDKYSLRLIVVHINHMLRAEDAEEDCKFVNELCGKLRVEFRAVSIDVAKFGEENKLSLEEAGRFIRYREFAKVANEEKGSKIAVAHNMNDNAETMIMRLARGTGLKGLGGILPVRDNIIRPLLEVSRKEIEQYCDENLLKYRIDHTNNMEIYTRNKIRISILPEIEKSVNSNAIENMSKTSELFREEEEYLENIAESQLKNIIISRDKSSILLNGEILKKQHLVIRRRIIRSALKKVSTSIKDVSFKHIKAVDEILNGETGKSIDVVYGIKTSNEYGNIRFFIVNDDKNQGFCYKLSQNQKVFVEEINKYIKIEVMVKKDKLPQNNVYRKVFDLNKVKNEIFLRTRQSGDFIKLKGLNGTKKLKDYFIDEKITRQERDNIPLLAIGNEVIWIVGYRISEAYLADENTKEYIVIEFTED